MPDPRKKSPRAPSLALDEALERAIRGYDRERLHPAPTEVVAQNIGYKSANNGAALSALASLRYFGLLERPKEGLLAISKDVESYQFAPDEAVRRSLAIGFLKRPPLYRELLEKYNAGLPSDANLRFELIQERGFAPQAAAQALAVFKRSVEFSRYFETSAEVLVKSDEVASDEIHAIAHSLEFQERVSPSLTRTTDGINEDLDRIPVRLSGGRRAWIIVPNPLRNTDKTRLKAHIDLLLSQEDETASSD